GDARITALEVNHWGSRSIFGDDRGYTGFLVTTSAGTVFFPGDTAYHPGFRDYGRVHSIDVALLPIGAYNPFRPVHMTPADALQTFFDLRARYLVPIHWGTFVLSMEPIEEPPRWLEALAHQHGVTDRVRILRHGMSAVLPGAAAGDRDSSSASARSTRACSAQNGTLRQANVTFWPAVPGTVPSREGTIPAHATIPGGGLVA